MKKQQLIEMFGNAPAIAKRLGLKHRNVVYGWPDELTDRQSENVIIRMKAHRIPIPKDWNSNT